MRSFIHGFIDSVDSMKNSALRKRLSRKSLNPKFVTPPSVYCLRDLSDSLHEMAEGFAEMQRERAMGVVSVIHEIGPRQGKSHKRSLYLS